MVVYQTLANLRIEIVFKHFCINASYICKKSKNTHIMRKITLILSLLLLTASSTWASISEDPQPIKICILRKTPNMERIQRSPEYVPIQAYYDDVLSMVCISFLQNIGEVEVTITNVFDGDAVEYEVNSIAGSVVIPLDGGPGLYQLSILLSSGKEYIGEFEL